jgi:hypothetical protein
MCDAPRSAKARAKRTKAEAKAEKAQAARESRATDLPWLSASVRGSGEGLMTYEQWSRTLDDVAGELGGWRDIDLSPWIREGNTEKAGTKLMYGRAKPALVQQVCPAHRGSPNSIVMRTFKPRYRLFAGLFSLVQREFRCR